MQTTLRGFGLLAAVLFAAAVPQAQADEPFSWHGFPPVEGEVVQMTRFQDGVHGDSLLMLTAKTVIRQQEVGELRSKDIFAYRFQLEPDGGVRQLWQVRDFVHDCDLDGFTVEFFSGTPLLTDEDGDGQTEVWLPYVLECASDPGPATMKVIMYEGDTKYAVRGHTRSRVSATEFAGGDFQLSDNFTSAPDSFTLQAREIWRMYSER